MHHLIRYKTIFSFLIIIISFINFFNPVYGQFDSADGHGGGGNDSSAAYSGGLDQSSDKSAANASDFSDFSGGSDFDSGNSGDFGDYSDASSGDTGGNFDQAALDQQVQDAQEAAAQQANAGGTGGGTGLGGPLSNIVHTMDNGVVITIETEDPETPSWTVVGAAPVLSASLSCSGTTPQVNLSWIPATGPGNLNTPSWAVLKSGITGFYATPQGTNFTDITTTTAPIRVVLPNTIYYYRVLGYIGSQRTPLSNTIGVLTPDCSPPAPTVALQCTSNAVGAVHDAEVSWTNNYPNVTGFKVYRGTNGDPLTKVFLPPKQDAASRSMTDTTLSAGTSYNYWYTFLTETINAPWTEITSTDENGNPTGFVDHPQEIIEHESILSRMSAAVVPQVCADSTPPVISPASGLNNSTVGCFDDSMSWPQALDFTITDNPPPTPPSGINQAATVGQVTNVGSGQVVAAASQLQALSGTLFRYNLLKPSVQNQTYRLTIDTADVAGNTDQYQYSFRYVRSCTDWIQTTGGNVHSEGKIDAPGGP